MKKEMLSICLALFTLALMAGAATNLVWFDGINFILSGEGGTNPASVFPSTQTVSTLITTNLTVIGGTNYPAAGPGVIYWHSLSNMLFCCDGTNWQALW